MTVSCYKLTPPFRKDFIEWYPYLKPENISPTTPWLPWLQRVFAGDTSGIHNTFFVARDDDAHRCIGVVWRAVSNATPEHAHLGWFLVEDEYQGQGVGRQLLENYLDDTESSGVEMVMLPTQTSNTRAVGMYQRRGWEITMAQPDEGTRCWMVREPDFDYQEEYFRADGTPLSYGPVEPRDYVGLDYLMCRPVTKSRLLPAFAGQTRFCSFITNWMGTKYLVARQGTKPVGLATVYEHRHYFDAFALDEGILTELLTKLAADFPNGQALVAETDERKQRALRGLGFRLKSVHTMELPGETVRLRRMSR
ncbi:MAG: GNAT family N-acetyltransferase [Armatimonadia bacterium]